jgi:CHAT domain-containing protein
MRPADEHLTPQEMESLLFGPADPRDSNAAASAREAQLHLSGCAVCQSVAETYRKADEGLRVLLSEDRMSSGRKPPVRTPECPDEEVWLSLAAGLLPDQQAANHVFHAAGCDWCSPRLKEAMQDLAYSPTKEEEEALAKLPTASAAWQRDLGEKLAKMSAAERAGADQAAAIESAASESTTTESSGSKISSDLKPAVRSSPLQKPAVATPKPLRLVWWPKLAWSLAAVAVLAMAGWFVWVKTRPPDVNELLAQAYTQHRTIELRMPGAKYGPMRVQKGPGDSQWPEQFRRAQMILSRDLPKHMDDPAWLQAQARAELLQRNYDAAVNEFDEALAIKPNDPSLLIDKATTLYMRAQEKGREMDFGEAADTLSKVLQSNRDNTVALFNRALVYEKLNNPRAAIEDLDHYLQLDPVGPWAEEARGHLKTLKQIASLHISSADNLVSPAAFVNLASHSAGASLIERHVEDYQDLAIKEWLPRLYSGVSRASERDELLAATRVLAEVLASQHADHWIKDFLATAKSSPEFIAALNSLKRSMAESERGNPLAAYSNAKQAEHFFSAAGSDPGVVRAQWQQVHALQRMEDGPRCLAEARRLAPALRDSEYSWIKIQFGIDRGACLLKIGNYDQGRAFVSGALKIALASGFADLKLRNIGMACSAETITGDFVSAWATNEEGLQEYWSNSAAHPVRAHQFYEDLAYASQSMQWLHLATAFAVASARTAAEAGNANVAILSWQYAAKLAIRAGELETAALCVQQVDELTRSLPISRGAQAEASLRASRVYRETTLAEIAIRQGKLSEAEKRLGQIQSDLLPQDTLALVRSFHLAKAELLQQQGKLDDAENEFLSVLKIVGLKGRKLLKSADQKAWNDENRDLYQEFVYLEIKKGNSEKALNIWEWYRAAGIHLPDSFSSIDEYLDQHHPSQFSKSLPGKILLSYALLPEGLVIWLTDERGTRPAYFNPLNTADLSREAANFGSLCADPTSDLAVLRVQGHRLYDIFIGPIADQLVAEKALIVDMDEAIGDLPFQVLVTPDGGYLGQKYTSVFSPGLLYTEYLREPTRVTRNSNALIVGSTANILQDGASLLPDEDAVREAREIAGRFEHPNKLFGAEASVENIQRDLPRAELFHFSGHALSGVEEGLLVFATQNSGTALWNSRALDPALFGDLQLAVLSACSTGRAFGNRREVHGAIVRWMLAARVPNVIGSRWDVDAVKTRMFFGFFYDALFEGQSAPQALHYAQTQLMGEPETQHPYYWAAFSAFGHA